MLGALDRSRWFSRLPKYSAIGVVLALFAVAGFAALVAGQSVASAQQAWVIAMSDSFSSNASNWNIETVQPYKDDFATITETIGAGAFRLEIKARQSVVEKYWPDLPASPSNTTPPDMQVAVEGKRISGPVSSSYLSVFMRKDEDNNYYLFSARDDGKFAVELRTGGDWVTLIPWTNSAAIRPGQVNRLAVGVIGSHFRFLINSRPVAEIDDDRASGLTAGLAINADENTSAVFQFSQFEVSYPPASLGNASSGVVTPARPTVLAVQPTPTRPVVAARPTATPRPAAAAPSGKMAFGRCDGTCDLDEHHTIWTMNLDGTGLKKILDKAAEPALSSDGTKIAYYHYPDGIYVANADGTNPKKVVGDTYTESVQWSHDARWLAFGTRPNLSGNIAIDVVAADGTGRRGLGVGRSPFWSPDDSQIVYDTCRGASCGIFKSSSAGGQDAVPVVTDAGGLPAWSPDGQRIVYQSEADGQKQIFVIRADGSGKKQLTSGPIPHVSAAWSPDGNHIFYRSPEGGSWSIWRMNADGSNPIMVLANVPPGNWAYERLVTSK